LPTTLLGLAFFIVLLAPGLFFFLSREARRPQRELSAFRETAVVVLVGFGCDLIILLVFSLARLLAPTLTPDVGTLLRHPTKYSIDHITFVSWWAFALIVGACLLGLRLGRVTTIKRPRVRRRWPPSIELESVEWGPIRFESAWYRMFHGHWNDQIYCSCTLEDGSWVGGYLASFSTEVEESADRELVLTGPIRYRAVGDDRTVPLATSAAIVSARRLMFLDVQYLDQVVDVSENSE